MAKPTLVVNPLADAVFTAFAETLVDHGAATPDQLERRLRSEYREATVHARLLSGEPGSIWYVYRDGHWVHPASVEGKGGHTGDGRSTAGLPRYERVDSAGRGTHSGHGGGEGQA